jgi:hypothetical protein
VILRILNSWGIAKLSSGNAFVGVVRNHPRFPDGTHVATSSPVAYDPNERIYKGASGGLYALGKPNSSYALFCPPEKVYEELSRLEKIDVRIDHKGDAFLT